MARRVDQWKDVLREALTSRMLLKGNYGPGEFARRLDLMLRSVNEHAGPIVETFEQHIARRLETPLLLTLRAQFRARGTREKRTPAKRLMVPKGQLAKMHVNDDRRPPIAKRWCTAIERACAQALRARFAERDPVGTVWVDPKLAGIVLPLDLRGASDARRSFGRGSRVQMEPTRTVRLFLWWKETEHSGRVDVDLGAVGYNDEWQMIAHVDYTSLATTWATHSGDVQSAPSGAAEFIDIDVEKARGHHIRYVLMTVISFTGQPFATFSAHAGAMTREHTRGQRLDPSTVETKFAIERAGVSHIPVLLDLETRDLVWADLAMGGGSRMNIAGRSDRLGACARAVQRNGHERPTLHDLIELNVEARGRLAAHADRADADRVITLEEATANATSILHEWMGTEEDEAMI